MIMINDLQQMIDKLAEKQNECIARYSANNTDLEAVTKFNQIAYAINKAYNALKEIDNGKGESL